MLIDDASTGRRVPVSGIRGRGVPMPVLGIGPDLRTIPADLVRIEPVRGLVPILRLTTRTGRELRAAPGQEVRTVRRWEPIEAVRCDERIAVARSIPEPGSTGGVSPDEAEILGMLTARPLSRAGNASGTGLFRHKDPGVVDAMSSLVKQVHGQTTTLATRGESRVGLLVTDDLRSWADREVPSDRVPDRVFGADGTALARFMAGVWSVAGIAGTEERRPSAEIRGLSVEQVSGLQHLMLRLGVLAVARAARGDDDGLPSVLIVSGPDPLAALASLPLRGGFADGMVRVRSEPERLKDGDLDYMPEEVTQSLARCARSVLSGVHAHDAGGHGWELSRREYDEAIAALPPSSSFRDWAGSAVLWDAVESIETDGLAMCQDVQVIGARGLLVNDIWVQG